jgi:hypothetical protein
VLIRGAFLNYEWVKTFKSGRTSVCDEARSERLSVSRAQEHVVCADALMQDDRITAYVKLLRC